MWRSVARFLIAMAAALAGVGVIMLVLARASGPEVGHRLARKAVLADWPLGLDAADVYGTSGEVAKEEFLLLAALGEQLFHDAKLSGDSVTSCASCHKSEHAYADNVAFSRGAHGAIATRNTPTIANRVFADAHNWDGSAPSLERQALGPLFSPAEMNADRGKLTSYIAAHPHYYATFLRLFDQRPTVEHVATALAAFQRTLVTGNSAFDRHEWGGDEQALTASSARGLELFRGKARCSLCHIGHNLTDELYHAIGLPESSDMGRYYVTLSEADRWAFRTPTLRNVAETAPYMHDGSLRTLEEVVAFYNMGGRAGQKRDPMIIPLRLTYDEKADLLAFLRSLSAPVVSSVPLDPAEAAAPVEDIIEGEPSKVHTLAITAYTKEDVVPRSFPVAKNAEYCGGEMKDASCVVNDRRIANVVVWVKDAPRGTVRRPSVELSMQAAHCNFAPRVQVAMTGDVLRLESADPITHNPHGWLRESRTVFNVALANRDAVHRRVLREGGIYRVDCDTHEWMRAFVHVFDHGHAAVTDSTGRAEILGLPSGTYKVGLWHESFGELESSAAASDGHIVEVSVVFDTKKTK
jgi:cytochrome c peroxidase